MSAERTEPCSNCGEPVLVEHTRCLKCGVSQLRFRPLGSLETTPGAPVIRTRRRERISAEVIIPASLREEREAQMRELAESRARTDELRDRKWTWAVATGAALTAFPLAVPTFLFLPGKWDALLLLFIDAVIGGISGSLTLRLGGGALRGLFSFAFGIALSVWLRVKLHYPVLQPPVALPVLASAVIACVLVATIVGVALDEHGDQL